MESEEEQHMTTLLCMGFSDAAAIRRALRLAKNDINEAVALLTNERPGLHYEPMDSVGSGGTQGGGGGGGGGPGGHQQSSGSTRGGGGGGDGDGSGGGGGSGGFDPPPAYHEVVENEVTAAGGEGRGGARARVLWPVPVQRLAGVRPGSRPPDEPCRLSVRGTSSSLAIPVPREEGRELAPQGEREPQRCPELPPSVFKGRPPPSSTGGGLRLPRARDCGPGLRSSRRALKLSR